ncbi:MAG: DUF1847 domain-containing protein [Deltaproteobacteria bacterium]|nr:DUF1847 domain-containing protein [Deltaproteobacteria bacterium]
MKCATCKQKLCYQEGKDCPGLRDESLDAYDTDENRAMMQAAAKLEAGKIMDMIRVEELMAFAQNMGYSHLGIAFCIGLASEARSLAPIIEKQFNVSSVCCKVCGAEKKDLGLPETKKEGRDSICNPLGQALVLNRAGTDMNILLGLCVGHDMLFTSNSQAPVSTLIVKDRVLANNPAGALYSPYYKMKLANNK